QLHALPTRLDGEALDQAIASVDLVLDCCDNFQTRHAVNKACVAHGKPLISGAAIRMDGQLACFNPAEPQAPCYHCLFPEGDDVSEVRCATMGVFAPLTGVIGTLQATEALKTLARFGQTQFGKLTLFDARSGEFTTMKVRKDPGCKVCGH
ncbi:MAG: ThiF family adenylyltransferase, partial [Limnobacter sp.]|nr:ThiF family adenylyltransferase [Limnobacter sp.]